MSRPFPPSTPADSPSRGISSTSGLLSKRWTHIQLLLGVLTLSALADTAQAQEEWNPFAQGRIRASILAGGGYFAGESYMVLGVGGGYYVLDGLEVGLDTDVWFLRDPTVVNLSPQIRYVFHMVPTIKPYVGTFYRHAFVFGHPDWDSVGARVGAFYVSSRTYLGGGIAYERWFDCSPVDLRSCHAVYPEILFAIGF